MNRAAFHSLSLTALMAVGLAVPGRSADNAKLPPSELLQYVQNAKQQGLTEAKIKKQALSVGWSASVVDETMAYDRRAKTSATAEAAKPPVATVPARNADPAPAAAPEAGAAPPVMRPPARASSDDYVIGSGDSLQISVWKEPEASVPVAVVRPDGKITMPLIKEVAVAGKTPREVEQVITAEIGKYISDPNVTVVVATINSKKIYLIGAVKREGTLAYTYGMTIMQALSEAGGLTDYAKRKRIYILRSEGGREYRLDFNYEEVVRGERMEQNAILLPGDTIVIPQ